MTPSGCKKIQWFKCSMCVNEKSVNIASTGFLVRVLKIVPKNSRAPLAENFLYEMNDCFCNVKNLTLLNCYFF